MGRKQKVLEIPLSLIDTDPVSDMLAGSDAIRPYIDHYRAVMTGTHPEKTLAVIAALPEDKRYLSRVLECLAWALADYDSATVRLDMPYMKGLDGRREELQNRLWQLRDLIRLLG